MQQKNTGLKRIMMATWYSIKGIQAAFKSEAAIRQEILAIAILTPIAIIADISMVERILLFITLFSVLVVELLNTAIETVVDRVSFDQHELSGKAKDIGSAAVFISILVATGTWVSILVFGMTK